ncbi:conserved hypothetical protein [Streptomyces viridosporus ATCC 14672]|uniref:Uncharacterized protein n=1 Tax=Streptomyces viridosporus (strain ATCC 14672 / DSM 40746 / JCM 4963 / KCTC 9882 / NRRL B-12104 / FH 1290) TaxID=566461 RepID=D5ZRJ1_STRV1|nr:conserved hypothetical protein [Streptomyces viridosporus ATCC 14672]
MSRTWRAPSASPRTNWSPTSTCCPCAAPASAAATCWTSTPTASASGGTTPPRSARRPPSRCGSPPTRPPPCWSPPAPWPRCPDCARPTGRRCCGPRRRWRRRPVRRPAPAPSSQMTFRVRRRAFFADVDRTIAERRRLWIRYYSPARDEVTEREIDPIRLVSVGHTYVEAWCRRSEARRTFRLDRVAEIRILDEPSAPPEVELRDLSEGLVQPAAEDPEVVVEVGPGGRWVAEYYPHDSADELPDGGLRITLRTPDPASLRRLALRLGRDGRIVEPRELADSARQAAREALAAYDGDEAA